MRTTIVPLRNIQFKPAFWGVDRNLRDVMETIEHAWEGSDVSINNFKETDQAYLMSIDMPGVSKSNLEIETEGDQLTIKAKRKIPFLEDNENNTKEFLKTVDIPKLTNRENIQANCIDGVLYLAFPKAEKAKPKKILVNDESKLQGLFSQLEHSGIDERKN
jgi:HSP20 family protein